MDSRKICPECGEGTLELRIEVNCYISGPSGEYLKLKYERGSLDIKSKTLFCPCCGEDSNTNPNIEEIHCEIEKAKNVEDFEKIIDSICG